jgi:hypothetical protein
MSNAKNSMKKSVIVGFLVVIFLLSLFYLPIFKEFPKVLATCPQNTVLDENNYHKATLVGELTSTGNATPVYVWFEWGSGNTTPQQSLNSPSRFCNDISGLSLCTCYSYKAVAQNSAGTSYGSTNGIKTKCPSVDLDGSGGRGTVTLTWRSYDIPSNYSCEAYGSWSGSKSINGSETIRGLPEGTYFFGIRCPYPGEGYVFDNVSIHVSGD